MAVNTQRNNPFALSPKDQIVAKVDELATVMEQFGRNMSLAKGWRNTAAKERARRHARQYALMAKDLKVEIKRLLRSI